MPASFQHWNIKLWICWSRQSIDTGSCRIANGTSPESKVVTEFTRFPASDFAKVPAKHYTRRIPTQE